MLIGYCRKEFFMDKEKEAIRVCIISYRLDLHSEIAIKINDLCVQKGITEVITIALDNEKHSTIKYEYGAGVLILDNNVLNEKQIKSVNQFSEKRPLFVLNIGDQNNKCLDQIKYERIDNLNPYDSISLETLFLEILHKYS
jgi:hypothetical protein